MNNKALEKATKWFDERIASQPAGKISIPRITDSVDIIKHWNTIKQALTQPTKEQLRDEIIKFVELHMGKIRFREEKYWTYIEFYGELVFDNEGKRWIEICHYSPSRKVLAYSRIQFPIEFTSKIIKYFELEEE